MIRRHDGSIIKAYGDVRDDLILELEKRIYNNCKVAYDSTLLDIHDVVTDCVLINGIHTVRNQ